MGSWSVSCGVSNIAITDGNECCIIPLKESAGEYGGYSPATLPIFGVYNDYGGMENIVNDENTKLIEKLYGITIDEFIKFLVDGKFTYDRDEVNPIIDKLEDNKVYDKISELRFMWVDKKVYDFMSKSIDKHEQHDFGSDEFIEILGWFKEPIDKHYFRNRDSFGDRLLELTNIRINLHPMSGCFAPHKLYLTPQCGEYEQHQMILEEFANINKSYIDEEY